MATMIELTLPDGEPFEAWWTPAAQTPAHPDAGERPGVLLFIDAIGLRQQIADMADRIASWGYGVLAPNVFHQWGTAAATSPEQPLMTPELRQDWFGSIRPRLLGLFDADNRAHLLADLRGYAAALHAQPGVSARPIGITGYCMGARLAILTAGELGAGVAAVGGFHGGNLVTDDDLSPHRAIPNARAEFWFGHAENDGSNTPEQQAALDQALTEAGLRHGAMEYPGATHGYSMNDTAMYHQPSAERHYDDLRSLFERTLG